MINNYFTNNTGDQNEQSLVEDLVIEAIQISGKDFTYLSRSTNTIDNILNEIANSSFEKYRTIEMYVSSFTDYSGNAMLVTQFGLPANNTAEFVVSRKRFAEVVQPVPLAGDLIYDNLTKLLWQIDYVDSEPAPNYQIEKLFTYKLRCSLYTYSYEKFATGITQVDTDLNNTEFVDNFAKNTAIQTEAEEVIDTSESNPLGEEF